MMTKPELIAECLVDSTRSPEPERRSLTDSEIRSAIAGLAAELENDGERRWANRLRQAAAVEQELLSFYKVSHILYWLRRDRCLRHPYEEVDRLLYAIGLTWPPTGRPPGPPRTTLPFIP